MKYKNRTKVALTLFAFIILTAQTCKQLLPVNCDGIEIFYGPLIETFGLASDNHPRQQDRFYTANLYYKSNNSAFNGLKVDFQISHFEQFSTTLVDASSTNSSSVDLLSINPIPLTNSGEFSQLGTMVWRVKYTDFGTTAIGKQRYTFIDRSGQAIATCTPSFVVPPMESGVGGVDLPQPSSGYIPLDPVSFADITIKNDYRPVFICIEEGKLQNQVSSYSECAYKHLEIRYQYLNAQGIPSKQLRTENIDHEKLADFLRTKGGTYNGIAYWCDNGLIASGPSCGVCRQPNYCRRLTFKM